MSNEASPCNVTRVWRWMHMLIAIDGSTARGMMRSRDAPFLAAYVLARYVLARYTVRRSSFGGCW